LKLDFINPEDPSDKTWQIMDGKYPSILLEYPNTGAQERFPLLIPKDPQHYNPIMELTETLEHIIRHYVPVQHRPYFGTLSTTSLTSTLDTRPDDGHPDLLQALRTAEHTRDGPRFIRTLGQINAALRSLKSGKNPDHEHIEDPDSSLDHIAFNNELNLLYMVTRKWCGVPVPVWKAILAETYQRSIGPSVAQLKEYTPHSSETYGELEATFVSDIVHHCGVTPSSRFVDLGCGVGNVVLQLSLQAGCEAYGIELRSKLVTLAEKQRTELKKRCQMWGVTVNENVVLEQGDFRESQRVKDRLREADVVLVNNFKFKPDRAYTGFLTSIDF
jgi:H3 lysine-79-specific histone-lysine N-methyltransferase